MEDHAGIWGDYGRLANPLAIGASVKNINFVMEYDEPYEGRLSRTVL